MKIAFFNHIFLITVCLLLSSLRLFIARLKPNSKFEKPVSNVKSFARFSLITILLLSLRASFFENDYSVTSPQSILGFLILFVAYFLFELDISIEWAFSKLISWILFAISLLLFVYCLYPILLPGFTMSNDVANLMLINSKQITQHFHMLANYFVLASLSFSLLLAVPYLNLEKKLKDKSLLVEDSAVSLVQLNAYILKLLKMCVVALSISIVLGILMAHEFWSHNWLTDYKFLVSILMWLFFMVVLFLRTKRGYRGQSLIKLLLVCELVFVTLYVYSSRM